MHTFPPHSPSPKRPARTVARRLGALAAGLALASTLAPLAHASWTPDRPIEIVVGFAPGGSADQIARQLSTAVKDTVPVPVVVLNRPGASGSLAALQVARAKPDGYQMFVGGGSETTSVGNHQKIDYDPRKDFTSILKVARLPPILAVKQDAPYQDMKALIAAAKSKPEALSFGSTGESSLYHSILLVLEAKVGAKILHVPYKGAAESLLALASGQVDMAVAGPDELRAMIDGKRIRPLAVFSATRVPSMPDVPTMAELGYPIALDNMKGLMAPAGLPQPVYEYLHKVFKDALDSPSWKAFTEKTGLLTDYADGPAFQQEINASYDLIGDAVREARK